MQGQNRGGSPRRSVPEQLFLRIGIEGDVKGRREGRVPPGRGDGFGRDGGPRGEAEEVLDEGVERERGRRGGRGLRRERERCGVELQRRIRGRWPAGRDWVRRPVWKESSFHLGGAPRAHHTQREGARARSKSAMDWVISETRARIRGPKPRRMRAGDVRGFNLSALLLLREQTEGSGGGAPI